MGARTRITLLDTSDQSLNIESQARRKRVKGIELNLNGNGDSLLKKLKKDKKNKLVR